MNDRYGMVLERTVCYVGGITAVFDTQGLAGAMGTSSFSNEEVGPKAWQSQSYFQNTPL
jgi:hypothetical protein